MATAFKELYPDPSPRFGVSSWLMSDALLIGPYRKQRFVHSTDLPGDLRIETDEAELRQDVRSLVDQLLQIRDLKAGWDTYQARAVDPQAFRPALDLALHAVQRCRVPRATANSDGGIVLMWEREDRELEIEVEPSGKAMLVFMIDGEGQEHEPDAPVGLDAAKGFIDAFCHS